MIYEKLLGLVHRFDQRAGSHRSCRALYLRRRDGDDFGRTDVDGLAAIGEVSYTVCMEPTGWRQTHYWSAQLFTAGPRLKISTGECLMLAASAPSRIGMKAG